MINERKNIDNLFADGLKGFKAKAPVHAWDRLSQGLDHKEGRKKWLIIRLVAASVTILFAFGAGYYFANLNNESQFMVNDNSSETLNISDENLISTQSEPENKNKTYEELNTTNEIVSALPVHDESTQLAVSTPERDSASEDIILPENLNEVKDQNTLLSRSEVAINQIRTIPAGLVSLSYNKPITEIASKTPDVVPDFLIPEYTGVEYTYGGTTNKKEVIKSRWSVGALFAPTYSYREISTNYENQGQMDPSINDNLNANEEALRSYAGGINVDFALSKRWALQSGMYYSRIGQVNNDALEYAYNGKNGILYAIHTSTGNINISIENVPDDIRITNNIKDSTGVPGSVQIEQNFDFVEVPFLLKYKVLNRKFSVNFTGGLSPAYLVQNNTYLKVDEEKYNVGNSTNLNSLLVNTSLGLGLEYLVISNLSISFEPTFKYSMVPLNKDSQLYYHPYSFSWFTGIKLRF